MTTSGPAAHLYVHAPFCARRCFYCDFAVTVRGVGDVDAWALAVGREMAALEAEGRFGLATALRTLYVGGGTPSLLGPTAMARLADAVGRSRIQHPSLEWTAEANPESLTPEVARAWRRAGVNRLSLGVQSFQDGVLRWMGRIHGARGARAAVGVARDAGITNLSIDLIFGLPENVERDWRADLEAALALEVPHVSLYGLTAEAGTPLGRSVDEGGTRMPEDDRYRDEYLEAHERLTAAGFRHYEVSNFSLPGLESRHNQAYWDGSAYLGLGNSSHSYRPPLRRWNLRDWDAYVCAVEGGRLPVAESEEVVGSAAHLERVWLGLRTARGLPLGWVIRGAAQKLVSRWTAAGLARLGDGRLTLTPEGWLLLDRLAVELSEATDPVDSG